MTVPEIIETNEITFSAPETITVAELRPGDFVVAVPAQHRTRGYRPNSGIAEISDPAHYGYLFGPSRRKNPIRSRKIRFMSADPLNIPVNFTVIARRRAGQEGA